MSGSDIAKKLKQYPVPTVAVTVSIVALAALGLRFGQISQLEAQLKDLEEEQASIERNARFASTLDEDQARLDAAMERIEQGVMDPRTKAENLDYFYGLEQRSKLRLTSVTQLPMREEHSNAKGAPKYEHWQPLPFEVEGRATFAETVRFLELLEGDRYLVRMHHIELIPAREAATPSAVPQLNVKLDMSVLAKDSSGGSR